MEGKPWQECNLGDLKYMADEFVHIFTFWQQQIVLEHMHSVHGNAIKPVCTAISFYICTHDNIDICDNDYVH